MKGRWNDFEMKKMKIKRFQKGNKDMNALQLKLVDGNEGAVVVRLVNEVGEEIHCGNLVTFYPDGTVALNHCVNVNLPFTLNSKRQLTFLK